MYRVSYCRVAGIAAMVAVAVFPWATTASADEMVPFQARHVGFAAPVFNADGTISNTEVAVGEATHLGLYTWASEELAMFIGPDTLQVVGLSFTMTAANGDKVFGTYEATGKVDFNTFIGAFIGSYEITGGTGRFANATGSGTIFADGNLLDPFEIIGGLSGTISQPNR
jgi:hypothetical protein